MHAEVVGYHHPNGQTVEMCVIILRGQIGCHTGKGEKLSINPGINQAEPGQAITSAVV